MFFDPVVAPGLYARLRDQVVPQLLTFQHDTAHLAVATCPGWSVKDVVAHVSGLVAETLAGVPLPRGSDEATARQVRDRRDQSIADICAEWTGNAEAFAIFGLQDPAYVAALTSDLVVHMLDIGDAVGEPIDMAFDTVRQVANRYGNGLIERAVATGHALQLVLDGDEVTGVATEMLGDLVLRADSADFLRAVTGRWDIGQVRSLDWTGEPESLLGTAWSQYGALRD